VLKGFAGGRKLRVRDVLTVRKSTITEITLIQCESRMGIARRSAGDRIRAATAVPEI